jgi:predicted kinase
VIRSGGSGPRDGAAQTAGDSRSHVLLIGGRSGVGKTTAAIALHELLADRDLRHAVIEGDNLDLAHPAPHVEHPGAALAERNLAAMWAGYRELGHRRLVYTNTTSIVFADELAAAMGDDPRVTSVLLRASDATATARLDARAVGAADARDVANSAAKAARLDELGPHVQRIETDGLTPREVAVRLLEHVGWAG